MNLRLVTAACAWLVLPAIAAAQTTTPTEAASLNLTAYAELLRSDVRAQKVAILVEMMGFSRGGGQGLLAPLPRVRRRK